MLCNKLYPSASTIGYLLMGILVGKIAEKLLKIQLKIKGISHVGNLRVESDPSNRTGDRGDIRVFLKSDGSGRERG